MVSNYDLTTSIIFKSAYSKKHDKTCEVYISKSDIFENQDELADLLIDDERIVMVPHGEK